MANWSNRIVGEALVDPKTLLANPANWRVHPKAQQEALRAVLNAIGWVQRVIVNTTTGHLIDGHLRVEEAMRADEQVPVLYVELSLEEERAVLSALDPLSGLADTDHEKITALRDEMALTMPTLKDALEKAKLWEPPPQPRDKDGDVLKLLNCTIAEPTAACQHGEVYKIRNQHFLIVADVLDDSAIWKQFLNEPGRTIFCPYPGPMLCFTSAADDPDTHLVMVQPDPYIAGHILDQLRNVYGEDAYVKVAA